MWSSSYSSQQQWRRSISRRTSLDQAVTFCPVHWLHNRRWVKAAEHHKKAKERPTLFDIPISCCFPGRLLMNTSKTVTTTPAALRKKVQAGNPQTTSLTLKYWILCTKISNVVFNIPACKCDFWAIFIYFLYRDCTRIIKAILLHLIFPASQSISWIL